MWGLLSLDLNLSLIIKLSVHEDEQEEEKGRKSELPCLECQCERSKSIRK